MRPGFLRTAARAGVTAGLLSGIPSTVVCMVLGRDPLEATAAAGAMLLPHEQRQGVLVAAAIPVHAAISLGWAVVLTALLPARRTLLWGAAAGLAIAALDLGPLARPFPRIRALPLGPQIADHVAFGAIVGACVRGYSRSETGSGTP
ncbi:MAG TPA: hypothetical protein VHV50_01800 [Actinomycetota bacterium]|jgi:hypothetical protein|nr:hypothetical protein [Actinomycetota bacterium]